MTAINFSEALRRVLKHEGGYVDHPRDPGGATNRGITIGTLSDWLGRRATKAEVRNISDATVAAIYRKNYWDAVGGDSLPSGVDYAVFDYAVNSGVSRAMKHYRETRTASASGTINALCDRRMRFLRGLGTWDTFGKGWQRRVDDVRKHALAMTTMQTSPVVAPPPPDIPKPETPAPAVAGGFWSRFWQSLTRRLKG
jgi:lysozyme family protein